MSACGYVFDWFLKKAFLAEWDVVGSELYCALIKGASDGGIDPTEADEDPAWGAAGTVDYSSAEVAVGGNYTTGGNSCPNEAVAIVAGQISIDFDDPAVWAQDAANPTNARWGIVYTSKAGQ